MKDQSNYYNYGRNADWNLQTDVSGHCTWDGVKIALLMDIRSELRRIRTIAECPNAIAIPNLLRQIVKQTKPTRRRKK